MSLFLKCPECGGSPVTTTWKYQKVPYDYPDTKEVDVHVPVRQCWKCLFEWTDWVADELRDEAVREARASNQGGSI